MKRLSEFPDYAVTTTGDVYSLPRQVWNGHNWVDKPMMKLKGNPIGKGYLQVTLSKNKKRVSKLIHVLVAQTFIPNNNPMFDQINHKDGDKTNNNIDNLEWCNNSLNQLHAWKLGLQPSTRARRTTGGLKVAEINELGEIIKTYTHARHAELELFKEYKGRISQGFRYGKNVATIQGHKFIKI